MFELQTILVLLVIAVAFLYIGRRAYKKMRGMSGDGDGCETGCGKCGSSKTTARIS